MTVVTLDLPPAIVLGMEQRAHNLRVDLDDVYSAALASVAGGYRIAELSQTVHERIAQLVTEEHKCDADIAEAMGATVASIATIRRSMGLPANRRRWKTR